MKSKILIFVNTLLILSYVYVNSFNKIEGFNAILLIIIFGLAMVSQLVFATILKPEKINIRYVSIVLLRLVAFLTIPLQKNIYLYAISVIITLYLDFWQYSNWKINKVFNTKTYTEEELIHSKKKAEFVFVSSLIMAALVCYKESFSIVLLAISFYKLYNMQKSGYRICMTIECCISAIFIILKRMDMIDSILLYVLALLLFISYIVMIVLLCRKNWR